MTSSIGGVDDASAAVATLAREMKAQLRRNILRELAPRDVVARAIDFEMKRHGIDCVYLDISHQSEAFLHEHFPTILVRCRGFGIDIAKQPIPVVPAAHYICGGVVTDLADRTDCAGLYAVGEYSYTGLHGANRLASNSLLECLVVGRVAAQAIEEAGVSDGFITVWRHAVIRVAVEIQANTITTATRQSSPYDTWRLMARMCHSTMPWPIVRSIRPVAVGIIAASASSAVIDLSPTIERTFSRVRAAARTLNRARAPRYDESARLAWSQR